MSRQMVVQRMQERSEKLMDRLNILDVFEDKSWQDPKSSRMEVLKCNDYFSLPRQHGLYLR